MTRLQKMNKLKTHPMLKNLFRRLTQEDLKRVEAFVIEHDALNNNDYISKVNRWMLDENPKPKHYSDMWAIVLQSV